MLRLAVIASIAVLGIALKTAEGGFHRHLLNIFRNDKCETQFSSDGIRNHLDPGQGVFHCFKNHVSCIDYKLVVDNQRDVLVVITERDAISGSVENNKLESYLNDTVCTDHVCAGKHDVNDRRDYAVVVINSNFTDPLFNGSTGELIGYSLDLHGCLTVHQKIVIALIVVGAIFGVCGCLSCVVVYYRRSNRPGAQQQNPDYPLQPLPPQKPEDDALNNGQFAQATPPSSWQNPFVSPGFVQQGVGSAHSDQTQVNAPPSSTATPPRF